MQFRIALAGAVSIGLIAALTIGISSAGFAELNMNIRISMR
ncbi:MAG: hypothetical protein ACOCW5_03210 [Spirochaetia bacterium]